MEKITINEKEYEVKTFLPLKEKYDMAVDAANLMYDIDYELGIVYEMHTSYLMEKLLILKYYVGFPIEELGSFEEQCDAIDQFVGALQGISYTLIDNDSAIAFEICDKLIGVIEARIGRENSIEYKLLKAFGSLLTGEDIVSILADAKGVNESLLAMVEKVKVAGTSSEKDVSLGNVLSFAKKEKK